METIRVHFRGTRVPLGKHPHEVLSEGEEFHGKDAADVYAQAERRADDLARIWRVPVRAIEDGDRTAFYSTAAQEDE